MAFNKVKRFLKIDIDKLQQSDRLGLFWLDVFMIWLVFQNLMFFGFDWLFKFPFFQDLVANTYHPFFIWYRDEVHPNFANYDLIFVGLFLLEFLYRWGRAIRKNTYELWWFYPFVHWYDVLGLIPMKGSFKFLRLFRLLGMVIKLQKIGVIDLKSTKPYKLYNRFINILVEEVSDRVSVNVITMAQAEVAKGTPLADKIVQEVIKPKEEALVNFIADTINTSVNTIYSQQRMDLKHYLDQKINQAVRENKEIDVLRYVPGLGKVFQQMLDSAISDITFNVIDKVITDLSKPESKNVITEITDTVLDIILSHTESQSINNQFIIDLVNQTLEIIKEEVATKEWKKYNYNSQN